MLTVNEIIRAQEICFLEDRESCGYCTQCPLKDIDYNKNCQKTLAQATIDKLKELTELLDDKVNHHYYDTLEHYQEENEQLRNKFDQICEILEKDSN